jgi:hypothetical protein
MFTRPFNVVLSLILCTSITMPTIYAKDKEIKPVKEWKGTFVNASEEPLMNETPKKGYIANQKAWEKLWKAWRSKEELPKIDFDKQVVFVASTQCAANRITGTVKLSDQGDLRFDYFATEIGGPGFAYQILVVDLEGVKTINGKPIDKE